MSIINESRVAGTRRDLGTPESHHWHTMSTSGSDCIVNMGNGSRHAEDEEACIAKLLQEALPNDSDQPTNPSGGLESQTSTPDNAKRRVDLATPSLIKKRCLVTQLDEFNGLEYAYCLPRSASDTLVSSRETLSQPQTPMANYLHSLIAWNTTGTRSGIP